MRIRSSSRLALFGAMCVLLMAIGASHLAPTPTFASQARNAPVPASRAALAATVQGSHIGASVPLSSTDFHQVALQGFGDPLNTFPWSMAWYKDKLYVGTNRAWLCISYAMFAHQFPALASLVYPPFNPDLVIPCDPNPQALPIAAQIWSLDPSAGTPFTQTNWTKVYESPYNVTVTITQTSVLTSAPRDMGWRNMSIYNELDGQQALYVSGVSTKGLNGPGVPPPSLLRTTDGVNFQAVPSDPGTTLGNINDFGCCMRGSVTYNGKFYVIIGTVDGSGAVYVSSDPRLGDNSFQQLTPPGMEVYEIQTFNNHLYLGLLSSGGYTVVRMDDAACTSLPCPSSAFTTIVPAGGGLGAKGDPGVTSMHVFTTTDGTGQSVPHLYVGTATSPAPNATPIEVVRINPDDSWDLIVGNPRVVNGVPISPTSGLKSGFGWPLNYHAWRMEDYNGVLYVGTFDNSISYKNTSVGSLVAPYLGFDLWASTDGLTFKPVTLTGFGDPLTFGVRTMQATPYGLFVGGANEAAGLRMWLGSLSTSKLQLTPNNVQVDNVASQGAVTLAWNAPSSATQFHVYRSMSTNAVLPSIPDTVDPELHLVAPRHSAPATVSMPGAYTQIATTTAPYFVDQSARRGGTYSYYVVAQDAQGRSSEPSNVATSPAVTPAPTFQSTRAVLKTLLANGKLTVTQATAVSRSLQAAYGRLRAGDAQGSHRLLATLRAHLLTTARGQIGGLYAQDLDALLGRLDLRIQLVKARVLAAQRLN